MPKPKFQLVEVLVKSFFIASNYHLHMRSLECLALNEEIKFYRSSYSLQKNYVESVINSFKARYEQFTNELQQSLKQPLNELIEKFWMMKNESTEDNLKQFLNYFKNNTKNFKDILKSLEQCPDRELIGLTFQQILIQLENEIVNMNKAMMEKIADIQNDMENVGDLMTQSDELVNELVKHTPENSFNDSAQIYSPPLSNIN